MQCNLRKLLSAHKSHVRKTCLFTGAIQIRSAVAKLVNSSLLVNIHVAQVVCKRTRSAIVNHVNLKQLKKSNLQCNVSNMIIVLYCIVFKYLYSAPQQPWTNRGAFGSISSKKRDKF